MSQIGCEPTLVYMHMGTCLERSPEYIATRSDVHVVYKCGTRWLLSFTVHSLIFSMKLTVAPRAFFTLVSLDIVHRMTHRHLRAMGLRCHWVRNRLLSSRGSG